MPYKALINNLI